MGIWVVYFGPNYQENMSILECLARMKTPGYIQWNQFLSLVSMHFQELWKLLRLIFQLQVPQAEYSNGSSVSPLIWQMLPVSAVKRTSKESGVSLRQVLSNQETCYLALCLSMCLHFQIKNVSKGPLPLRWLQNKAVCIACPGLGSPEANLFLKWGSSF